MEGLEKPLRRLAKGSGSTAGKFLPAGRAGICFKTPPILSNETDLRQGTRVMGLVGSWRSPLLAGAPSPTLVPRAAVAGFTGNNGCRFWV